MSNALAKHTTDENHEIDFENTKVVFKEKNQKMRLLLEGFSIAANAERKMNLAPPNNGMINWINFFKNVLPDVI